MCIKRIEKHESGTKVVNNSETALISVGKREDDLRSPIRSRRDSPDFPTEKQRRALKKQKMKSSIEAGLMILLRAMKMAV